MDRPPLVCRYALVLCTLLGMAACTAAAPDPSQAGAPLDGRAAEAAVLAQINATIGQAPCSSDAQCRTVGIGSRSCGGPAAWRAWSTQTGGETGERLHGLAEQLATSQRGRQTDSGMASTCLYLADPGAVCQAQRCVLKKTPNVDN